jgi:hypothetical protein
MGSQFPWQSPHSSIHLACTQTTCRKRNDVSVPDLSFAIPCFFLSASALCDLHDAKRRSGFSKVNAYDIEECYLLGYNAV